MDLLEKHKKEPSKLDVPIISKDEETIEIEKAEEEAPKKRKERKPALRELFYLPS